MLPELSGESDWAPTLYGQFAHANEKNQQTKNTRAIRCNSSNGRADRRSDEDEVFLINCENQTPNVSFDESDRKFWRDYIATKQNDKVVISDIIDIVESDDNDDDDCIYVDTTINLMEEDKELASRSPSPSIWEQISPFPLSKDTNSEDSNQSDDFISIKQINTKASFLSPNSEIISHCCNHYTLTDSFTDDKQEDIELQPQRKCTNERNSEENNPRKRHSTEEYKEQYSKRGSYELNDERFELFNDSTNDNKHDFNRGEKKKSHLLPSKSSRKSKTLTTLENKRRLKAIKQSLEIRQAQVKSLKKDKKNYDPSIKTIPFDQKIEKVKKKDFYKKKLQTEIHNNKKMEEKLAKVINKIKERQINPFATDSEKSNIEKNSDILKSPINKSSSPGIIKESVNTVKNEKKRQEPITRLSPEYANDKKEEAVNIVSIEKNKKKIQEPITRLSPEYVDDKKEEVVNIISIEKNEKKMQEPIKCAGPEMVNEKDQDVINADFTLKDKKEIGLSTINYTVRNPYILIEKLKISDQTKTSKDVTPKTQETKLHHSKKNKHGHHKKPTQKYKAHIKGVAQNQNKKNSKKKGRKSKPNQSSKTHTDEIKDKEITDEIKDKEITDEIKDKEITDEIKDKEITDEEMKVLKSYFDDLEPIAVEEIIEASPSQTNMNDGYEFDDSINETYFEVEDVKIHDVQEPVSAKEELGFNKESDLNDTNLSESAMDNLDNTTDIGECKIEIEENDLEHLLDNDEKLLPTFSTPPDSKQKNSVDVSSNIEPSSETLISSDAISVKNSESVSTETFNRPNIVTAVTFFPPVLAPIIKNVPTTPTNINKVPTPSPTFSNSTNSSSPLSLQVVTPPSMLIELSKTNTEIQTSNGESSTSEPIIINVQSTPNAKSQSANTPFLSQKNCATPLVSEIMSHCTQHSTSNSLPWPTDNSVCSAPSNFAQPKPNSFCNPLGNSTTSIINIQSPPVINMEEFEVRAYPYLQAFFITHISYHKVFAKSMNHPNMTPRLDSTIKSLCYRSCNKYMALFVKVIETVNVCNFNIDRLAQLLKYSIRLDYDIFFHTLMSSMSHLNYERTPFMIHFLSKLKERCLKFQQTRPFEFEAVFGFLDKNLFSSSQLSRLNEQIAAYTESVENMGLQPQTRSRRNLLEVPNVKLTLKNCLDSRTTTTSQNVETRNQMHPRAQLNQPVTPYLNPISNENLKPNRNNLLQTFYRNKLTNLPSAPVASINPNPYSTPSQKLQIPTFKYPLRNTRKLLLVSNLNTRVNCAPANQIVHNSTNHQSAFQNQPVSVCSRSADNAATTTENVQQNVPSSLNLPTVLENLQPINLTREHVKKFILQENPDCVIASSENLKTNLQNEDLDCIFMSNDQAVIPLPIKEDLTKNTNEKDCDVPVDYFVPEEDKTSKDFTLCICREKATLLCLCKRAAYCSINCQGIDWPDHQNQINH